MVTIHKSKKEKEETNDIPANEGIEMVAEEVDRQEAIARGNDGSFTPNLDPTMTKQVKERNKLSPKEIVEMFKKIQPQGEYVNLVPERVSLKTDGGLDKTPQQVEKEERVADRSPMLIVSIGDATVNQNLEVGLFVVVSEHAMPAYMYEGREGYKLRTYHVRDIVNIIK